MWVRARTLLSLRGLGFEDERKQGLTRAECTQAEEEVLDELGAGWVRRVSSKGELLVWIDRTSTAHNDKNNEDEDDDECDDDNYDDSNTIASLSTRHMYFPTVVTILAFVHHALLAIFANYIPDDTLAGVATAYALFGTAMSIVGLLGVISKRPYSVVAFASFLLLDAFITAICQLLLLQIFVDALFLDDQSLWGNGELFTFGGWRAVEYEMRHSVVTSARWQSEHAQQSVRVTPGRNGCKLAFGVLQTLAIVIVLGMAIVQARLSAGLRKYGKRIIVQEPQAGKYLENFSTLEKTGLGCA